MRKTRVTEQIAEIESACRSAGVPRGRIENDPSDIEAAIDDGSQILRVGGDISSVRSTLESRLRQIDD